MTKRNLLLASLLFVVGLGLMVPSAVAQQGNSTTFAVTSDLYTLRPNSVGDAAGPVYITYGSGVGTVAGGEVVTIKYTLPITGAAAISKQPIGDFCFNGDILTGLNPPTDVPTDTALDICDSLTASSPKGQPNVLQLTFASPGPTPPTSSGLHWTQGTISIWGLRFDTVGTTPLSYIYANVSDALNQQYPMYVAPLSLVAPPVPVGQIGYNPTWGWGSVGATLVSPATFLTCYMGKTEDFTINVAEQWAGAWTSVTDEVGLAPYLATNGSDISITLAGIPSGATVTPVGLPVNTLGTGAVWAAPLAPVVLSNGNVVFDFPLAATSRPELEAANFTFSVATSGPIQAQLGPITASVTLNPMTPTYAPLYPAFTYPFSGPTTLEEPYYPLQVVNFLGCQTSLLFPYVTNFTSSGGPLGNWDTGIVIANTSSDPYGIQGETTIYGDPAGAIPTAGPCAMYVFAATSGTLTPSADASPVATWNTNPVYTGGITSFLLSTTPAKGVAGGYAIAVCNFLDGTGYALIADNATGNWQVMANYLAYVIPNPFEDPRWYNAQWGEFAITPFPWYNYFGNYPLPNVRKRGSKMMRAPIMH